MIRIVLRLSLSLHVHCTLSLYRKKRGSEGGNHCLLTLLLSLPAKSPTPKIGIFSPGSFVIGGVEPGAERAATVAAGGRTVRAPGSHGNTTGSNISLMTLITLPWIECVSPQFYPAAMQLARSTVCKIIPRKGPRQLLALGGRLLTRTVVSLVLLTQAIRRGGEERESETNSGPASAEKRKGETPPSMPILRGRCTATALVPAMRSRIVLG